MNVDNMNECPHTKHCKSIIDKIDRYMMGHLAFVTVRHNENIAELNRRVQKLEVEISD